jgi:hypothetical protein
MSAYATNKPGLEKNTYYDLRVIYKGDESLQELYVGLFLNADIGCPTDDYFGFDKASNLLYFYNQDVVDGSLTDSTCLYGGNYIPTYGSHPPLLGVSIIDHSHNLGITATTLSQRFSDPTAPRLDVYNLNEFEGLWLDGTPQTIGGDGYNPSSTDTTTYLFTDPPNDSNGWSMCAEDIDYLNDISLILTNGGYPVEQDKIIDLTYVLIIVDDVALPCPDITPVIDALSMAKELPVSNQRINTKVASASVSPNPTKDQWNVILQESVNRATITDINGKVLKTLALQGKQFNIDSSDLPSGLYILQVVNNGGRTTSLKLIKS